MFKKISLSLIAGMLVAVAAPGAVSAQVCEQFTDASAAQLEIYNARRAKAKKRAQRKGKKRSLTGKPLKRFVRKAVKRNLTKLCGSETATDFDLDGIVLAEDNCPTIENPGQEDTGGSATMGDICEDRDGDGIVDASDNAPDVSNADQADADGDGVADVNDTCPDVADPSNDPNSCLVVDLAVVGETSDEVEIFFDALSADNKSLGFVFPSLTLDSVELDDVRSVDWMDNGSEDYLLIASNYDDDTVTFHNNLMAIDPTMPTPAADLVLDNATSLISDPHRMLIDDGDLYVMNCGDDTILIFRDIMTILAGGVAVAPTAVIDDDGTGAASLNLNGCSGMNEGDMIADKGTLYVSNEDDVFIFTDMANLETGDAATGMIDMGNSKNMFMTDDDILFIVEDSANIGPSSDQLLGYKNPSSIDLMGKNPDIFFGYLDDDGDITGQDIPRSAAKVGGRLWVGNGCDTNAGLFGYENTTSPNVFTAPDIQLGVLGNDNASNTENPDDFDFQCFDYMTSAGGALFGVSEDTLGGSFAYTDPASVESNQFVDIIYGAVEFSDPKRLKAKERK